MKYFRILVFITFSTSLLYPQAPKFSGELLIQNLPKYSTVVLQTYGVWGAFCENYLYLIPSIWYDSLYYIQINTKNTSSIYFEFHAENYECGIGESYGDGPADHPVIGYGYYRLSVNGSHLLYLNYLDADYYGDNFENYYYDGDLIITYYDSTLEWTTSSGTKIWNYSNPVINIWDELKNPLYPPDGSEFVIPSPKNLTVSWENNRAKLTWEMNWGIDDLDDWLQNGFQGFSYSVERKECTGFKYSDCSSWHTVGTRIIPEGWSDEYYWIDREVSNDDNDYKFYYRVIVEDTADYLSSSGYSNIATIIGDYIPCDKRTSFNKISLKTTLFQCFPNPFNNSLRINLYSPTEQITDIRIYDLQGRTVKEFRPAPGNSYFDTVWNGADNQGQPIQSGIYFLIARSGKETLFSQKIIYLK